MQINFIFKLIEITSDAESDRTAQIFVTVTDSFSRETCP